MHGSMNIKFIMYSSTDFVYFYVTIVQSSYLPKDQLWIDKTEDMKK